MTGSRRQRLVEWAARALVVLIGALLVLGWVAMAALLYATGGG